MASQAAHVATDDKFKPRINAEARSGRKQRFRASVQRRGTAVQLRI